MCIYTSGNGSDEMSQKIRKCDEGTEFACELLAGRETGAAHATDAQLMAMFCEDTLQILVGAYSPRLVWEGAQKAGMDTRELLKLCNRKNLRRLDDLQFGD